MDDDKNVELLARVKEKSEDDFEKNITFISAGTLVLSLTFIEKIISVKAAISKWDLIIAWIFLALTLLINLSSHLLSSYFHDKAMYEYYYQPKKLAKNIARRNIIMRFLNVITIWLLIIGIFFLILFSAKNVFMPDDKKVNSEIKPLNVDIKKGRTLNIILPNMTQQNNPNQVSTQTTKPSE